MGALRFRAVSPGWAVTSALAFMLLVASFVVACSSDEPAPSPDPTETPYPLAADAPPYDGPFRPVEGLFSEPRETVVDTVRSLGRQPETPFPPWDGESVVLYNLESGEVVDLGEGSIGPGFHVFSPDGARFVWVVGASSSPENPPGKVWVIDLETMERRSYGDARFASFENERSLVLTAVSFGMTSVDLESGEAVEREQDGLAFLRMHYPAGYVLEQLDFPSGPDPQRYRIVPDDGSEALEFDAGFSSPFGSDSDALFVMTLPLDGTMNVFHLELAGGTVSFIATVRTPPRSFPFIGVVDVNGVEALAIGDNVCGPGDGRTLLYESATGALTAIERPLRLGFGQFAGGLGVGGFSTLAQAIVDVETMEYTHVLPAPGVWSAHGRWAAVGPSMLLDFDPCTQGPDG